MAKPAIPQNPYMPFLAGILAWLFPGAGHFLIGERRRGAIIAVCIVSLFTAGLYIGSIGVIDPVHDTLYYYTQIFASPLVFLIDHLNQSMAAGTASGRIVVFGRPSEIGQIYTSVAGMLNLLCILSAVLMADAQQKQKKDG